MRRWLIFYGVLVVLAVVPAVLLLIPRAEGATPVPRTEPAAPQSGAPPPETPRLTVRVDGVEQSVRTTASSSTRLSSLPPSALSSSLVSRVRTSGSTQVLVLVDGSEVVVGDWMREALPADVQYRLSYERGRP